MSQPFTVNELLIRFNNSLKWLSESGLDKISVPAGWSLPDLSALRANDSQSTVSTHDTHSIENPPALSDTQGRHSEAGSASFGGVSRLLDEVGGQPKTLRTTVVTSAESEKPEVRETVDFSAVATDALLVAMDRFLEEEGVVDPQLKTEFRRALLLEQLKSEVVERSVCPVCSGRQEAVMPTVGPRCRVLFVADEPDEREQLMGVPYVGETGMLVARMVKAMGLAKTEVGFAYVNWCAHSEASAEDVSDAWAPLLERYIHLAAPEVIVAFGECAARRLTGQTLAFPHLRGQWFSYQDIPVLSTFHPSALMQHPAGKSVVWGDLKNVMRKLGLTAPTR
ncbi:MAG: uracil-DNA glycosylase [Bradymonadia bacterium]